MLRKDQFISPSKLMSWRSCPRRFKEEPFRRSEQMDFGDAVHSGIAEYFRGGDFMAGYKKKSFELHVPPTMDERAKGIFDRLSSDSRVFVPREFVIAVESDDASVETGDMEAYGKKFFQTEIVPDTWGLRGSIDLLVAGEDGETIRIIDWKTGMSEQEDDLQLACYALAASARYPGNKRIETGFYYLDKGVYQASYWDQNTLVGAFEYVQQLVTHFMADKVFPETPNKWCSYCSLAGKCKAFNEQLNKIPDRASWDIEATRENLPQIIEYVEKIEAVAKAAYGILESLKDKRSKILLETGPFTFNKRIFKASERVSSYEYDLASIFTGVQALMQSAPVDMCKFNSGGFDNMLKKLPKEVAKEAKRIRDANRTPKGKAVFVTATIAKETVEPDEETKGSSS